MWAKYNTDFILALDREELYSFGQPVFAGAVYSPGSPCASCGAVGQVQAVMREHDDCYLLVCDTCAITRWAVNTHPWHWTLTAYDGLPPVLQARHTDLVINHTIDIAQTFGWLRYTECSSQVLETLLNLVSDGQLTTPQREAADRLIAARGGMDLIKRRRDLQYRLQRLQRVPNLRLSEIQRLKRLTAANLDYVRYPQGLTAVEVGKLVALEKRYKDSLRDLDEQSLRVLVARSRSESSLPG
jgi:hypothetical protein